MKLVLFDKDGTLTETVSGEPFVQSPTDQKLKPGVAEKLAQLHLEPDVFMGIVSNQGGVAKGYKTCKEAHEEMAYAAELTGIGYTLFAPSYEEDGKGDVCVGTFDFVEEAYRGSRGEHTAYRFRKPEPGMLMFFKMWLEMEVVEVESCLMVGDRPEDEQAAKAARFDFQWAKDFFKVDEA